MGVHCTDLPLSQSGLNPVGEIRLKNFYVGLYRKLNPDYVLNYTVKPVIYSSIAAYQCQVPNIYSFITGLGYAFTQNNLKQQIVRKIVLHLYKQALPRNKKIFFLNEDDLVYFLQTGLVEQNRAVKIPGEGVDTRFFAPRENESRQKISFLLVARMLIDKGVREFLQAAAVLKSRHPHAEFLLLGKADNNPTAVSSDEILDWHHKGIVSYLGEVEDVRPHLSRASVFVLPSYREGLSVSTIEAMSMGKPIVTTSAPGCRETVSDGENGFLVPVKDASTLAQKMEYFIQNPNAISKMGKKSRELAVTRYDVHQVNRTLLEILGLN